MSFIKHYLQHLYNFILFKNIVKKNSHKYIVFYFNIHDNFSYSICIDNTKKHRFYIYILKNNINNDNSITICMQNPSTDCITCFDDKINIIKQLDKKHIYVINLLSFIYTNDIDIINTYINIKQYILDINIIILFYFISYICNDKHLNLLLCGQHFNNSNFKILYLKNLYKKMFDNILYLNNTIKFKCISLSKMKYKSHLLPNYINKNGRTTLSNYYIIDCINNNILIDCL